MPARLHHVVMLSHDAQTFHAFLTDVVGMEVQFRIRIPGQVLEQSLGWPPCDGADLAMFGSGDAGLVEVIDVPEDLRDAVGEGLAGLSFMAEDFAATRAKAKDFAEVKPIDTGVPGVDLFFCAMGGVPIEFMGSYAPESNSAHSDATNS
jgi:catechol 2,3-dioxygenase-like lactoylglutathione lyase family enzyme